MQQHNNQPPILEITILSAQNLMMAKSLVFSRHIRPFITLSTTSTTTNKHAKTYKTRVDDKGGVNPTWGDKFMLPLEQIFVNQRYPGIMLHLYTKHLLMGRTQLGWCLIPAGDIVSQFFPAGSIRFSSYRLRDEDGSRGHGVVNVALSIVNHPRATISNVPYLQEMHEGDESVIGIPVKS